MNNNAVTNVNKGPSFLTSLWVSSGIAISMVIARLIVRVRFLRYHGPDDYFIAASLVVGVVGVCLDTVSVRHGLGRHEAFLTLDQIVQATKYNFIAIPFNLMSSALAKCSVCFFLIHVNQSKLAGRLLLAASILLVVFSTVTIAVLFGQCTPPQALWNPEVRATGNCINPSINAGVGLAQAAFFVVADLCFAFFPLTFLWTLQMNRRTKFALAVVLSLGVMQVPLSPVAVTSR
ncbi:hypothetical protein BAUCODRAFT_75567 [Baudoinia panamericana UAMH 10762]|uniref:Rhodopsin domain-containing protein n=1 Tax=Baudoinia panamericana (strain UAMH 10762) TaxID=717646 RepID=M2N3U0_BAUPA|nr:uncharacterized protein BAUCODRAFT_75567 [Baudoinia panamericana UAMH 10762]EMC93684.1 hypothetical protein BAUCODRAFT_75567 [Baudoinia panamericana UAMH 10762]